MRVVRQQTRLSLTLPAKAFRRGIGEPKLHRPQSGGAKGFAVLANANCNGISSDSHLFHETYYYQIDVSCNRILILYFV